MANVKLSYADPLSATITLASLASDANFLAGQQSALIDNSSNLYLDYLISGKITVGTSPTIAKMIEIWAVGSFDGTMWGDVFDGTNSAKTITNAGIKGAICKPIAMISNDNVSDRTYSFGPVSIAAAFGYVVPIKFSLFVTQSTGSALNATAANHVIKIQPVYQTVV